jgi:hypothetical protein
MKNLSFTFHRKIIAGSNQRQPIPVAARSKAWVCGRSLAGIANLNPAGVWISVVCKCCPVHVEVFATGLIPRPGDSCRVCGSLSMIRSNNNSLHLRGSKIGQNREERNRRR